MPHATFRFYAELNDHLPPERRYQALDLEFLAPATVRDQIEGFGVPPAEVELIVVNGESCDFSRALQDGDRVAMYPMFEALDITPELRVRPQPLREPKFVLDADLGRLAVHLRMLGFDTAYRSCASAAELLRTAAVEKRILLTRERALLMHPDVTHGYWLRETESRRQAAEVLRRFDLFGSLHPFARCMVCNQPLDPGAARACPRCRRVYREGTQYERFRQWIELQRTSRSSP